MQQDNTKQSHFRQVIKLLEIFGDMKRRYNHQIIDYMLIFLLFMPIRFSLSIKMCWSDAILQAFYDINNEFYFDILHKWQQGEWGVSISPHLKTTNNNDDDDDNTKQQQQ